MLKSVLQSNMKTAMTSFESMKKTVETTIEKQTSGFNSAVGKQNIPVVPALKYRKAHDKVSRESKGQSRSNSNKKKKGKNRNKSRDTEGVSKKRQQIQKKIKRTKNGETNASKKKVRNINEADDDIDDIN